MLNQPSSTITAAFLAGIATALFWAVWNWLEPQAIPPAEVVSLSTTFISSVVGYFKRENVLPIDRVEQDARK